MHARKVAALRVRQVHHQLRHRSCLALSDSQHHHQYVQKASPQHNHALSPALTSTLCKRLFSTGKTSRFRTENGALATASVGGGDDESFMNSQQFRDKLETYSRFQPCPVSIAHFLEFGKNASLDTSFLFLRREVPVRLANIMKELQLMPKELKETRGCSLVTKQYAQSFKEITDYEGCESDNQQVLDDFTASLMHIRERHADTVISMAEAVMEVKSVYKSVWTAQHRPKFEKNIQYFLDRLYTSRISTRMLINQHTILFDDPGVPKPRKVDGKQVSMVGTINPSCEVAPIVNQAYESARFLCEQYYMSAPNLEIETVDESKRLPSNGPAPKSHQENVKFEDEVEFTYVPSHLYHILFELFKNAMRATIEYARDDALHFPPIKVLVVKGREDLSILVRDRGGGIPRSQRKRIFDYLYTTAPNPMWTNSSEITDVSAVIAGGSGLSGMSTAPLAGLGYGLPLSRLYARYFGGDLQLYSIEGWGTDAVIYLHALAGEAKERLPVYHETGSRKIYEAQLTASDWTDPSDGNGNGKNTGHNKDLNDL